MHRNKWQELFMLTSKNFFMQENPSESKSRISLIRNVVVFTARLHKKGTVSR